MWSRAVAFAGLLGAAACSVRAPAPIDVLALTRAEGTDGAHRDLVARILADPRDVQARLALAALADRIGRPGEAIAQPRGGRADRRAGRRALARRRSRAARAAGPRTGARAARARRGVGRGRSAARGAARRGGRAGRAGARARRLRSRSCGTPTTRCAATARACSRACGRTGSRSGVGRSARGRVAGGPRGVRRLPVAAHGAPRRVGRARAVARDGGRAARSRARRRRTCARSRGGRRCGSAMSRRHRRASSPASTRAGFPAPRVARATCVAPRPRPRSPARPRRRTADPDEALAWMEIGLRAALRGDAGWGATVRARIDARPCSAILACPPTAARCWRS